MSHNFPDAKAAAARQGTHLDTSQRELVETGQPYKVTLEITPRIDGFLNALRRTTTDHGDT